MQELLTPERIWTEGQASSTKSLFDQLAQKFQADCPELGEREVFQTLIERERLGSTALGHGIALPHGRLAKLKAPIGIFIRLNEPAYLNTLDHQPVQLVLALLVPNEECEEHVQLLARLAKMFADAEFRKTLLQATAMEIYELLIAKDEEVRQQCLA